MVQQDMGMFTESSSIKAGSTVREDRSTPWDKPGEWRERRLRHLQGALGLIERERAMSENKTKFELQCELDDLKRKIAALQDRVETVKKQSFKDTMQNKDLASADADAAFTAPVDTVEDLG